VILLDTSVVSAVLRRRRRGEREQALAGRVAALLRSDATVALPGIVFQELLSGIAERPQQEKVLAAVRESFPVVLATEGDHLKAADLVNWSTRKGLALSSPDALIAAQTINRRAQLFTTDADFGSLAGLAGLRLLDLRP
jgi:predicted nucleic acid-binding protein